MNPWKPCGPDGQSAWHPQGIGAGNGCSAKRDRAAACRDGPEQVDAPYRPSQDESNHTGWGGSWGHYEPAGQSARLPLSNATPAGYGRLEPTPPESQAPEFDLPQQQAERATTVQMSRESSITEKDLEEDSCSAREKSMPRQHIGTIPMQLHPGQLT